MLPAAQRPSASEAGPRGNILRNLATCGRSVHGDVSVATLIVLLQHAVWHRAGFACRQYRLCRPPADLAVLQLQAAHAQADASAAERAAEKDALVRSTAKADRLATCKLRHGTWKLRHATCNLGLPHHATCGMHDATHARQPCAMCPQRRTEAPCRRACSRPNGTRTRARPRRCSGTIPRCNVACNVAAQIIRHRSVHTTCNTPLVSGSAGAAARAMRSDRPG